MVSFGTMWGPGRGCPLLSGSPEAQLKSVQSWTCGLLQDSSKKKKKKIEPILGWRGYIRRQKGKKDRKKDPLCQGIHFTRKTESWVSSSLLGLGLCHWGPEEQFVLGEQEDWRFRRSWDCTQSNLIPPEHLLLVIVYCQRPRGPLRKQDLILIPGSIVKQ